ncbi:MAG TPA: PEP-CTERM sorting domain-containing protein [Pyrinomonadaceae bacterium]|nr:PEP-CTERM sorting domain-containing protein [Pyrinomonadaceae bacterium]
MRLFLRAGFCAVLVLGLGGLFGSEAKADPLTFSNVRGLQNGGLTNVDLFSHPGATLYGSQISFLVDISGPIARDQGSTLVATFTEEGYAPILLSYQLPLFDTISPPFTLLLTITAPGASYAGTLAALNLNILGSSEEFVIPNGPNRGAYVDGYTYVFEVAQPVPEPASVMIFGTGIVGLATMLRRRGRGRQNSRPL